MMIAAAFILIFFTVYASNCFVTCGKLFSTLFGTSYTSMLIVGAIFVLLYTLLGGFLAESASDFMQSIVMIVALTVIVIISTVNAGGIGAVIANAKDIPGFMEFFGLASPVVDGNSQQLMDGGKPLFGAAADYGFLSVCSILAWGLGYFGMPQVLLRFMAIRKEEEPDRSRRIAIVWVVISLAVAVFIGIVGRQLFPDAHLTKSAAENIFITLATTSLAPILAGFVMAGILAATISSSDSYLLIAASAFAKNIFQIVSFAWAGFGATFGPLMLFSLFWKRTNRAGAIAGMVGGAGMVFLWKLVISELGGVFAIYELLPAFIFSAICIVVVSLLTKAPSKEIEEDFEAVRSESAKKA